MTARLNSCNTGSTVFKIADRSAYLDLKKGLADPLVIEPIWLLAFTRADKTSLVASDLSMNIIKGIGYYSVLQR
jgi:hypothetical protein